MAIEMRNKNGHVDFDDYADDYEDMLKKQLEFFNKSRDYFSEYKVNILAELCSNSHARIIDFGCGIGLSLPHLIKQFQSAEIFATDVSKKSLEYVSKKYPGVKVLSNDQLDGKVFDLIFVAGVFHHVPVIQRHVVMQKLFNLMTLDGILCIFEHNPFNPVTRHMVSICPFDADAELISLRNMQTLISNAGFKLNNAGYCLFVPEMLQRLRPLERLITWLPLGGQYFVTASR